VAGMLKSSSYYTMANVIPQAIGFLLLPIYSQYMSPAQYGIVASMETLAYMFAILFTLGLERAAQRFYFDSKDIEQRKVILGTFFCASLILSALFVAFAFASAPILGLTFREIDFFPYFALTIIVSGLNSASLVTTMYYQVSEQPLKYLILNVSRAVLSFLLIIWFVMVQREGAQGQLWAQLACALIFLPVYLFISGKNFRWKIDITVLKQGLSYSWPFIPTILVAWVLTYSDRIFIEQMVNLEALGVYSMAYKLSMALLILTSSIQMAYTPVFYKIANSDDQVEAKARLRAYGNSIAYIFVLLCFFVALFANEVIVYMLDEKYSESIDMIRLLVYGHLLSAIMGATSVLYLMQAKLTRVNMYTSIFAALLNIALNFLLIPEYGVFGAVYATLISLVMLVILHFQVSKKGYFISVNWPAILGLIALSIGILVFFQILVEPNALISMASKVVFSLVAGIYLFRNKERLLRSIGVTFK